MIWFAGITGLGGIGHEEASRSRPVAGTGTLFMTDELFTIEREPVRRTRLIG